MFGTHPFPYMSPSFEAFAFLTKWVYITATCTVTLGGNLNTPTYETFAHKIFKSVSQIVWATLCNGFNV